MLRGKYIFTDLTTGRIWYADYKAMLAADDGTAATVAPLHEVRVRWKGTVYDSMFPVVESAYHERGGKSPKLPGRSELGFGGPADVGFSVFAAGGVWISRE